MTNLREVAAFLLGEGELDGVGFGDPHPTERGNYWWRKHLRAALAQPESEELGEIVPANEEQLKRIAKLVEPDDGYCQACDGNHCTAKNGCVALDNPKAQPEPEIEPDRPHVEGDGCPTEKAVLQRFWREHQKQEPVACPYCHYSHTLGAVFFDQNCAGCVNRMTAPPQREWQGLTDEEIREFEIWLDNDEEEHGWNPPENIVKYLEAKLREKNHG